MAAIQRRAVIVSAAAALATFAARSRAQPAPATPNAVPSDPAYPFTLPALPYAFAANEPHVDAQTMEIHHDRHHAAYVANLNAAVKDYPLVAAMPLSQMLAKLGELPEGIRTTVRNNGGGHANHSMFWLVMGGKGGEPEGDLAAAIKGHFGSFAEMKTAFEKAGVGQFGSGWAIVAVDGEGKLALMPRPNQDTPLMEGKRVLFGNDVWEHAYYLEYQNRRPAYLAAWWNVVNWAAVGERYASAKAGTLTV